MTKTDSLFFDFVSTMSPNKNVRENTKGLIGSFNNFNWKLYVNNLPISTSILQVLVKL